jgi:hypothetical protein
MIPTILMFASTVIATPIPYKSVYAQEIDLKNLDNTENLDNNDDNDATLLSNLQKAVSGNNVYVVWQDDTPGNQDIFFKRSTEIGKTFEDTENLSDNDGASQIPRIAIAGTKAG